MALSKAKNEINERLKQGYLINNELFTFDFNESEAGLKVGLINKLPKSTPNSPLRTSSENIPQDKMPIFDFRDAKKSPWTDLMEIEDVKENEDTEDNESETSYDYDSSFLKKKESLQRSETRVRSVSPENNSHSVFNRLNTRDENSSLGKSVNGIYESLQAPQKWDRKIDPSEWYLSEKLDGIRCFWDGTTLWSKKGKKYNIPDYFSQTFPKSALDGELYMGKRNNRKLALILQKKKPKDEDWNDIKFIVFDAPELALPFKKRLEKLRKEFSTPFSPYITLYEYKICESRANLMKELDRVEKEGGEGLIIRDPRGFYEKGKSHSVLEINASHYEEATVLGYESGKSDNIIGGLQVQNVYGIVFTINIGMTDALKKDPPKIGSKITYRFKTVNDMGIPKYPTIIRVDKEN